MQRRSFVLGAAAFIAGCSRQSPLDIGESKAPLGLQLYTVRDLMASDLAATLELVVDIGYQEVEFAGYFDRAPVDIRRHIERVGLSAPAAHVQYTDFSDDAGRVTGAAAEAGHRYLVVPSIAKDQRSLDDYRRHCDNFNHWGEACKAAGLQFAYHNHVFEFEVTDGEIPYELLLAETDPNLVKMELDLCWARAGNADVVAYFEKWPGRFPLLHLKDYDGSDADIGDGDVAFDDILAHVELAGVAHGFIERDQPADARRSIEKNYDAMSPIWSRHMLRA